MWLYGQSIPIELADPVKLSHPDADHAFLAARDADGWEVWLPARQETLRTAIDWRYNLLAPLFASGNYLHQLLRLGDC